MIMNSKIFIGIGANLRFNKSLTIKENCLNVIDSFKQNNVIVEKVSNWYESHPVPESNQPLFVNSVVKVSYNDDPFSLINLLHKIEKSYGRKRKVLNGNRTIDLDIIDFNGMKKNNLPILPHPRMQDRLFVLYPLYDIEPLWRHPISNKTIDSLIEEVKTVQKIKKIK